MHFRFPQKVLFKHCDPAQIVFYPRYFEMINDAVEAMFCDVIGWPFEKMHPESGVPTVATNVVFKAPSRHGDHLTIDITITALGGSSMTLDILAHEQGAARFEAAHTLVCIGLKGRPRKWPADIRATVEKIISGGPE